MGFENNKGGGDSSELHVYKVHIFIFSVLQKSTKGTQKVNLREERTASFNLKGVHNP